MMKPIKTLGCAVSMAVLLGATVPALAQGPRTSFSGFGCVFDPGELVDNGVISQDTFDMAFEEGVAFVGFITSKNCPGSQTQPAIQLDCQIPLDPDPGLSLSTRNFTCTINGAQCGFNQTFEGTNNRLTIQPAAFATDTGLVGLATIRCSRNVSN